MSWTGLDSVAALHRAPRRTCSWAGPLGDREVSADILIRRGHNVPSFFLPRRPLRCRWKPGAAQTNTWSTCSPCGPWGSGTAWRWGSPTPASAAAAWGWSPTVPDAVGMGLTCVACVSATPATWAPGASARKGRTRAGTRTCAGKRRASPCAAGVGSATATSVPASRVSLGRSTGLSASATTSPVPGIKASSAQVGTLGKHLCSEPGAGPGAIQTSLKACLSPPTTVLLEEMRARLAHPQAWEWGPVCQI